MPALLRIPTFSLYGEAPGGVAFSLHIETIAARSRRHDWRIASHLHRGLHQVLWIASGSVSARLGAQQVDGRGPLALALPHRHAHSFAFAPETQGFVLTFDARAMLEGEGGAGATYAALFASPRVVTLEHEPE